MIIGNYSYSPVEYSNGGACYFVKLNFEPRKVEHKGTFSDQIAEAGSVRESPSVESLSSEQLSALREKLNNGRGGMSLQAWDDFLADLEEMGAITHDERFLQTVLSGTSRRQHRMAGRISARETQQGIRCRYGKEIRCSGWMIWICMP